MFLGVVACLLFFNVLSSQSLTARIKPNRTSFVFESGIKPNITCESDCGYYNWMCMYKWIAEKNGKPETYIDKNNSRIDTPLKENVTLLCYVTHEYHNNIKVYSKRINLFIKERLLSTTTPIYDGENDNDERTNITKESEYPPRSVTISPSNDKFYTKPNGKPAQDITCKADCLPECTYTWYRESENFTTGNNLFARKSFDRTGSYRFRCHASNGIGSNIKMYSGWITVEVKDGPDNVTIKPSSSPVIENSSVQLVCSASCIYRCQSYSWKYNDKWKTQRKHILNLHSLSREDSGKYECWVTDDFGTTNSEYYTLNVQYPPRHVTVSPRNDIFYTKPNDKPAQDITCKADCLPECTYAWFRENEYFTTGNNLFARKSFDRTGSYRIRCHASNGIGSNSEMYSGWITVEVKDGPNNVTIKPSPSEKENDFLQLTCSASCYHECRVYRWYMYNNYNIRSEIRSTHILSFSSLSKTNRGKYQCEVTDDFGTNSANYTVNVQYSPKVVTIQYSSWYRHLIEGQDYITFTCNADCNPGCSYLYYQNGKLLNKRYINERVYRNMSGRYTCSAKNSIIDTYKNSSNSQDINIRYPPGIVTIAPGHDKFYTKRGGQPLQHITCEADCQPKCTYSWYRDGDLQRYTTGNRLFASKTYNYSGTSRFHCYATNYIGRYSRPINVIVKDGPDNVTIIPTSSAIENKPFQLLCTASCNPVCQSYSWYYNGRWGDQGTKILKFHYLSKDDSGNYRCRVTDYFGATESEYYTVIVQYATENVTIQYSSWYDHLIEGQDYITLICNADCNPGCSYMFYQNEKWMNNAYTSRLVYRNMSGRYTCSATNALVDTHMHSSNFVDINIKYKPMITSFVNRTILTAPSLLDLNFSVDSFPSSNVTIFHRTKSLTILPQVTGQRSFKVSITSCLDHGEYKVEAVNDAGLDSFTFIANVECSPIILRYSNLSEEGFQVGDSFYYIVDFMANPEAEVSWTFIDLNNKEPKELNKTLIQNRGESTMVIISKLNFSNFGKYELELKNNRGYFMQEFDIRGPPQRPTDLNVDCPHSAIILWRPGFDGGATQDFMIEYSDNSSYWLTHHPQSVVSVDNKFMSAQIHDIRPNTPYSFRIRAKNSFGVAASDTTVNCTRQNSDEMASFLNNRNALVGIGVLVLLLLIAFAALVTILKLKRRRESNNQDNSLRKQGNNSNEEDNASEIVENILYITADDPKEQVQAPVDTPVDTTQNGSDVYAVVEKIPKTDDRDDQPVYTDVCKADQKKKKPAIAAKPSKVKKDERPTVNKDGLIYVDLDMKDTPSTSTEAFVIHGADDRTQYVDIDFTRRADPPRDTDNEKSQNEKEKEKA